MNRTLVVLPNWYGETLFATPFLRALRQQCPGIFIAALGWPQCHEVLRHNPNVDEFIEYDERAVHRGLTRKWALITRLRAAQIDTAFILRRSLSRALLLAAAGIPSRVGFDHWKSRWLLTRRMPSAPAARHKSASYFPLLESVGLSAPTGYCDYILSDAERQEAVASLRAHRLLDDRPLVVLHPGANWFHKRWPPERFAALGERLVEAQRAQVILTGGPDDAALAESITARMHHPAAVLAGRTTLRQLGACLDQADLVVSNDTGVLHLAAALRRPLVALYGPTSPVLTGPLGDPARMVVLHHPECCPEIPCYHPDRPPHSGMDSISVDEAYDAAVTLLTRNE